MSPEQRAPRLSPAGWLGPRARAGENLAYLVCALLALIAIWGHRYPAGIDLPQHANLLRLWADLTNGPVEYRALYRIEAFTPYLLAYAVALPLTLAFGALVAVKCLLTLGALGTPLMMRQWLRAVGAREELALFGFLLAFDFQYQFGFLSQGLALPLMFGYLAAFERQGTTPALRPMLWAGLLGTALFFCHGITFGVCMVIVVVRLALEDRPRSAWWRALHALPLLALALLWLVLRKQHTSESPTHAWFVSWERLVTLFSGPFSAYPSSRWALVSLGAVAMLLLVTRPRLAWQARRLVPLVLALDGFLVLPEGMAATTFIASRFCVFVHAFAPAAIDFEASDWLRRQARRVTFALVAAGLLLLNARLFGFNYELSGLRDLAAHMRPGEDVLNLVPQTFPHSAAFGLVQFGQVPAWITAEHGGIVDNDSSKYYQIPVKRTEVPYASHYRYVVAGGDPQRATAVVTSRSPRARLLQAAPPWLLFEDRMPADADFTVVRSAQGWKRLGIDRAVSGAPLSIAGVAYARGLGTQAESFIRVHAEAAGGAFTGAYGLDDADGDEARAEFHVRDDAGQLLFESGEVRGGQAARRFSVPLVGRRELLLEVRALSPRRAHADWVDLRVQDRP